MTGAHAAVRIDGSGGDAHVSTGLPVLDHLVALFARAGRLHVTLDVAAGATADGALAGARALGEALSTHLRAAGASGAGWAMLPADEALASASLEVTDRPLVATNVDFSRQPVGGLADDIVARFLEEFAAGAGLNLHIRLVEGTEPEHVLAAIFKALGAAVGQAVRAHSEGGNA